MLKSVEEELKEKTERRDELKAIVLDKLLNAKLDNTTFIDMKVSVKKGSTRKTVDSSRLKDEMPDVYDKYVKETKVKDSLSIKIGG